MIVDQYANVTLNNNNNKYVRLRRLTYSHTCRSYVHAARDLVFGSQRVIVVNVVEVVARWPICPILGFWGAKFTKKEDSLSWTPMNRRAKFDAASFPRQRNP